MRAILGRHQRVKASTVTVQVQRAVGRLLALLVLYWYKSTNTDEEDADERGDAA